MINVLLGKDAMINEKIKLRYQMLWEKYKRPTIGKKEYAEIYSILMNTIDKYIASEGMNLVPYKKSASERFKQEPIKKTCTVFCN